MSHLISTTVTESTCPRCRRPILTALDEGLPAHVDTTPIDRQAEIAALLQGRWTYTLTTYKRLEHRDATRIAGAPRGTVHAEHQCNAPTQLTIDDLTKE